ncbi:hypothetical protein BKH46_04940 [Helicobacter sp. 12S02634-8]|uniref:hypothetical protein n=1 Tax=Helicobacter sp. 12S02634-8 TaxID=1476199 RepID=UPI000BA6496C|nr:hypothetical protein [Helicobacter sp. 12S02634-8]PAF47069.1 hypothetical protein BKH46_04940 [Helicobacter sp. 12S02634-8]
MKISILCQSALLQEALMHYLEDSLSDLESCDFIITDTPIKARKPICLIASSPEADIRKPFTQASLFKDLHKFEHSKLKAAPIITNPTLNHRLQNPELKMQIDSLLEEFSRKIYQALQKHDQ